MTESEVSEPRISPKKCLFGEKLTIVVWLFQILLVVKICNNSNSYSSKNSTRPPGPQEKRPHRGERGKADPAGRASETRGLSPEGKGARLTRGRGSLPPTGGVGDTDMPNIQHSGQVPTAPQGNTAPQKGSPTRKHST